MAALDSGMIVADEAVVEVVKPKRGRKPKNKVLDDNGLPIEEPSKKKVTTKVVKTFSAVENQTFNEEEENIILKLNVAKEVIDKSNDNDLPGAFNIDQNDTFLSKPMEFKNYEETIEYENLAFERRNENDNNNNKVIHLLKDFEQKSKNNEWPTTTQISCYWCCHKFNNAPFGIPVKYVDNKYHVFGCFCSLECAAAFNFGSKESVDEIWEQYNLINQLSRDIGHKKIVKPAPSKLALKMFGGHMSIEAFREFCFTSKIININFPPMITLTQQIEEFNETDINTEYKYIPLDTERINKYKEKMKLKRTKPLTDHENTLDKIMFTSTTETIKDT